MIKAKSEIITNSPEETIELGKKIAKMLKLGDIVYIIGELGTGKTTLIKGIAKGLNIKEEIRSTSFLLSKNYQSKKITLSHMDFYRLKPSQAEQFYIENLNPKSITIIEWADKIKKLIKEKDLVITIEHISENKRKITLNVNFSN